MFTVVDVFWTAAMSGHHCRDQTRGTWFVFFSPLSGGCRRNLCHHGCRYLLNEQRLVVQRKDAWVGVCDSDFVRRDVDDRTGQTVD